MQLADSVHDGLNLLSRLAPEGYALALRIHYQSALKMVVTYPGDWVEYYGQNSYALCDPVISWGLGGSGTRRWSALDHPDPHGVMAAAERFGLRYGVAVSCGEGASRSIGGFARGDREFTDGEMARIGEVVANLHRRTRPPVALTPGQRAALQLVAQGSRHSEASAILDISESAFKARLKGARQRLLARTTAEAVRKARENGLV